MSLEVHKNASNRIVKLHVPQTGDAFLHQTLRGSH